MSARVDATKRTGRYARPSASANDLPGLAQREVERRALERPAPVVARRLHLRLGGQSSSSSSRARVVVQRPRAGEHLVGRESRRGRPRCT